MNNPRDKQSSRSRARAFHVAAICFATALSAGAADNEALWKSHVEPLLKERCTECHSPTKSKSGLDLTSLQSMLRGGDRGPAVVPGKPDDSNLYKFLLSDADPHMPPGSRKKLDDDERSVIAQWIRNLPMARSPAATAMVESPASAPAPVKSRITWKPDAKVPASAAVDQFLELSWQLDNLSPSRVTDDSAFARRVYLDLAGRIPTSSEAAKFLSDQRRDKRVQLVDTLLATDEYARHMREVFDTVLMNRAQPKFEDRRASEKWFDYLEDSFRRNRPWNEVVRDLIVARPQGTNDRGAVWFLYERENNPQSIAESLAPVVFGVQIKCAQCHDHMVAREIKQAHYWGMVAAFNRSKNVDTPQGPAVSESAIGGFVSFANLKKESQPAVLTFFNGKRVEEARPKDGEKENDSKDLYLVAPDGEKKSKVPAVPKFSRRTALADAVTRDNPLLARAMVNRVWAMLFGRGIVHPVDLMDSKHPASHPELLDWLARDFERSGYDVKRLVRTLCNTRAYQLETTPAQGRVAPPESFARALDKPLSAEQLYRSLLIATGHEVSSGMIAGRSEKEIRRAYVKQFPDLFPAEYNATLQQAMFFSNSPLLDDLLTPRENNLAERLLKLTTPETRVREAFQVVYGRPPARDELDKCVSYLVKRSPEAGVKQLLWAMLTGGEFQLNH